MLCFKNLWHCFNDRTVGVVLLTEDSGRGGGDLMKKRRLSNRSFGRLGAVQVTVPSSVGLSCRYLSVIFIPTCLIHFHYGSLNIMSM